MALLSGSPAINAAAGCPATDQRGVPRPQGANCDIGAYEFVTGTTTTLGSSQNPSVSGQSVTFTAAVADSETGSVPTGTVTFFDGATSLGAGALDGLWPGRLLDLGACRRKPYDYCGVRRGRKLPNHPHPHH